LSNPQEVFVNQWDNVFVADSWNHRIMRWSKGSNEGSIVIGNGYGNQTNELKYSSGLSLDGQSNLYALDNKNHRVQNFIVD
jgi:sugar lactone lactonase YvrE